MIVVESSGKNEEEKKIVKSLKHLGDLSSSGDVLKGLLSKKIRFQPIIPQGLMKLPMIEGYFDVEKMSPIHKVVLGDAT